MRRNQHSARCKVFTTRTFPAIGSTGLNYNNDLCRAQSSPSLKFKANPPSAANRGRAKQTEGCGNRQQSKSSEVHDVSPWLWGVTLTAGSAATQKDSRSSAIRTAASEKCSRCGEKGGQINISLDGRGRSGIFPEMLICPLSLTPCIPTWHSPHRGSCLPDLRCGPTRGRYDAHPDQPRHAFACQDCRCPRSALLSISSRTSFQSPPPR